MIIMTATQAQRHFGLFLEVAEREPVLVTRRGRSIGVFLSMIDLEDMVLGNQALSAHAEGYLGPEESRKFLEALICQ